MPFVFEIDHVYAIYPKGIILVGRLVSGEVHIMDYIAMPCGENERVINRIFDIEANGKKVLEWSADDGETQIALACRWLSGVQVQPGRAEWAEAPAADQRSAAPGEPAQELPKGCCLFRLLGLFRL